jgi:K+-transporting ATPase ATPase B chain
MKVRRKNPALLTGANFREAALTSFKRLTFAYQMRNPVMFVVYVSALLTSLLLVLNFSPAKPEPSWFIGSVAFALWFTVIFANFAEAVAEGKGKAQAESLRKARRDITAKKLAKADNRHRVERVSAATLREGDIVLVEANDLIPADGQVVEGIAAIDESAITGESAPVIRESGADRDAVTGGTRVLSDWLVVRVSANPGESFLDKMIELVEGARRHKTPNEIALGILLAAITIVFLVVCATLLPFSLFSVERAGYGQAVSVTVLVALLVCLAPTTIGALLSAIGIAGMNRLIRANVVATSGRAVEAAGDVSILLLDKTGTITQGNRQAVAFLPARGVTLAQLATAATLASLADDTPEGKSIVSLARANYGVSDQERLPHEATFIPFAAETRISGVTIASRLILKGATDAVESRIREWGGRLPDDSKRQADTIARQGGTPLMVADGSKVLGVIQLKDIVKAGIKQRLADLRAMGIKSVMITGDNPLTAAAIASEAGVDDYIAQATPETKLIYIRRMQESGEMIAMVGDGTNDAPALAQADVAVAMNSGTQAAKEASNMVDLDSNPTKLIEIVEIGKQLLMTRGSLTAFSLTNDVAKYFAIIPAVFASTYPFLEKLNVMNLTSPHSAILAAVIFNALVIAGLIPLALKGVAYRPVGATRLLGRNLFIYGGGGILAPFIGIKAIDMVLKMTGVG